MRRRERWRERRRWREEEKRGRGSERGDGEGRKEGGKEEGGREKDDKKSVGQSLSGLRVWRCCKLWRRSQTRLESCVAVVVV